MWPFRNRERKQEFNSGEKIELPTRLRMPDRDDRIRQMIRHELFRQAAGKEEAETFEEADDFELDEGEQWVSPYEDGFDPDFDSPPAKPQQAPEPKSAPAPSQQENSTVDEPPQPPSP